MASPTTAPTTSPTTSPTTVPTVPAPTSVPSAPVDAEVRPHGPTGDWTPVFEDEFDGTAVDPARWNVFDGKAMNNVIADPGNVAVVDGRLELTLAGPTSGAFVATGPVDGRGSTHFLLRVGDYVEARVSFPGDGARLYNWPAFWTVGPRWPSGGEHDVAEVLGGSLTVNYHSSSGTHNQGAVPGYWGDAFHVYGLHRAAGRVDVYWDGAVVASYPTDDDASGHSVLVNVGREEEGTYGPASRVLVDYVRAFRLA